jgi:head-tail adaptor
VSRALTRRLTLEAPEDAPDGAGGAARGWRALGGLWADVAAVSATERMSAGAPASRVTHRAAIRWAAPGAALRPTPAMRLRDGARVFEIVGVGDADPWRRFLICWLAEGTDE